jgi:hypothetical protein
LTDLKEFLLHAAISLKKEEIGTNEFITVIEDQAPHNSAGYQARAHHIIRAMKKLEIS